VNTRKGCNESTGTSEGVASADAVKGNYVRETKTTTTAKITAATATRIIMTIWITIAFLALVVGFISGTFLQNKTNPKPIETPTIRMNIIKTFLLWLTRRRKLRRSVQLQYEIPEPPSNVGPVNPNWYTPKIKRKQP
jgi:uncharacterized protein YneF (UPF0154 family)